MIKKLFCALVLSALTLVSLQHAAAQSPTAQPSKDDAERIAKVKKDLADIGLGNGITVSRKDNRDFFGKVRKIGANDFEVIDADSKTVHIFKYEDIKNVRSGEGVTNRITGKRSNSRVKKGILWGLVAGAAALIVVIIATLADDDF